MNRIQRRVLGAALAVASSATAVGVAAPAAHAATVRQNTTVTPAVYHWACQYGGEASRVWIGSKGAAVKQAQCLLDMAGYHLMIDGVFGQQTNLAVLSFQHKHHLARDGIVGPKTWRALDKYNKQVH
jgi:peptidoglycan hydrolase-like protein with peptidoglycan-binding domain